ncbi:MAG: glycosyltransferase family 2 protein [Elusimicrobiota bacterium]
MGNKHLSIVIPVYNEQDSVQELYGKLKQLKGEYNGKIDIIFVDDGSTDSTGKILKDIAERDKSVSMIILNMNYGQTLALAAGIKSSIGEIIVTMDSDLQNDPMDIPKLLEGIEMGYDVVSGWRKERKDAFFSRLLPSMAANALISFLTRIKLHDFGCTLKAYRREYVDNISIHGEMHRFLPAYCAWQGARIVEIVVNHHARKYGKSKYGFGSRTFKVLLDLLVLKFILSYFTKPIYVFGGVSLVSVVLGILSGAAAVISKLYLTSKLIVLLSYTSVLLIFLGIICFLMGLLAEVLVRLYFEVRKQPIYRIREKINI